MINCHVMKTGGLGGSRSHLQPLTARSRWINACAIKLCCMISALVLFSRVVIQRQFDIQDVRHHAFSGQHLALNWVKYFKSFLLDALLDFFLFSLTLYQIAFSRCGQWLENTAEKRGCRSFLWFTYRWYRTQASACSAELLGYFTQPWHHRVFPFDNEPSLEKI